MKQTKYEVVEEDADTRDSILASLVENPTQGVAYMCLKSRGPMSAADIIESLALSDTWFTGKFNSAVATLAERGLIKAIETE